MRRSLLVLPVLVACHRGRVASDVPDYGPWTGIVESDVDDQSFRTVGYELATFTVTDSFSPEYRGTPDVAPSFLVFRPAESDGEVPTIVWLHGGAMGNDSEITPEECANVIERVRPALAETKLVTWALAHRRWAVVFPINDFCDGFYGLGPDDPTDPVRHWGALHVDHAMGFVAEGYAGFDPAPGWYGYGTSTGAAALMFIATRRPEIGAIVSDSGPYDLFRYAMAEDPLGMAHILGGLPYDENDVPTDLFDVYAARSATTIVSDGGLRVPLLVTYNAQDMLVPVTHGLALDAALGESYGADGTRYAIYDFDHAAPGDTHHVQTQINRMLGTYTTVLSLEFLEGKPLVWAEVEDGCVATSCIGVVADSDEPELSSASRGRYREATSADGTGSLYSDALPAEVASAASATATVVLTFDGGGGLADDTVVARLRWDGAAPVAVELRAGQFAPPATVPETGSRDMLDQIAATRISFVPDATGSLSIEYLGAGTLRADAIVFATEPP